MSFTLLALAGCQSMPKVAQETPNQAFSAETESGEAQERLNQINFKQLKKEQNRPIIAFYAAALKAPCILALLKRLIDIISN